MLLLHISMPFHHPYFKFPIYRCNICLYMCVCMYTSDIKDYLPSKHKVTDIKTK